MAFLQYPLKLFIRVQGDAEAAGERRAAAPAAGFSGFSAAKSGFAAFASAGTSAFGGAAATGGGFGSAGGGFGSVSGGFGSQTGGGFGSVGGGFGSTGGGFGALRALHVLLRASLTRRAILLTDDVLFIHFARVDILMILLPSIISGIIRRQQSLPRIRSCWRQREDLRELVSGCGLERG